MPLLELTQHPMNNQPRPAGNRRPRFLRRRPKAFVECNTGDLCRRATTLLHPSTPARERVELRVVPERLEVGLVQNHVAEVGVHLQRVRQVPQG